MAEPDTAWGYSIPVRIALSGEDADTGVGISSEAIPLLFKKFSRADNENTNLLGSGIGLYLAKTVIEAQGGRIWAESEGKGHGSRFVIQPPAARSLLRS